MHYKHGLEKHGAEKQWFSNFLDHGPPNFPRHSLQIQVLNSKI